MNEWREAFAMRASAAMAMMMAHKTGESGWPKDDDDGGRTDGHSIIMLGGHGHVRACAGTGALESAKRLRERGLRDYGPTRTDELSGK